MKKQYSELYLEMISKYGKQLITLKKSKPSSNVLNNLKDM